jgi:hypothetical protein
MIASRLDAMQGCTANYYLKCRDDGKKIMSGLDKERIIPEGNPQVLKIDLFFDDKKLRQLFTKVYSNTSSIRSQS